jgi:hypothetical protein
MQSVAVKGPNKYRVLTHIVLHCAATLEMAAPLGWNESRVE